MSNHPVGQQSLNAKQDLARFAELCRRSNGLQSLRTLNLNIDTRQPSQSWMPHVLSLLSHSPLETFYVSANAGEIATDLPDAFCADLINAHHQTLRSISVNRMRLSMHAIRDICLRCQGLERLFVALQHENLVLLLMWMMTTSLTRL